MAFEPESQFNQTKPKKEMSGPITSVGVPQFPQDIYDYNKGLLNSFQHHTFNQMINTIILMGNKKVLLHV